MAAMTTLAIWLSTAASASLKERGAMSIKQKKHGRGGLADRQTVVGLEPLATPIHQRNQRDGHVEELGDQRGELLELRFGRGVQESVADEGFWPCGFSECGQNRHDKVC